MKKYIENVLKTRGAKSRLAKRLGITPWAVTLAIKAKNNDDSLKERYFIAIQELGYDTEEHTSLTLFHYTN